MIFETLVLVLLGANTLCTLFTLLVCSAIYGRIEHRG